MSTEPEPWLRAHWGRSKPVAEGGLDFERRWRRAHLPDVEAEADAGRALEERGVVADYPARWSAAAHDAYATMDRYLTARFGSGQLLLRSPIVSTEIERVIDERPCDPLLPEDGDWLLDDEVAA